MSNCDTSIDKMASAYYQIQNYRLDFDEIGKGAFGIVYRGIVNDTEVKIAAKKVKYRDPGESINDVLAEMNEKEGDILLRLNGHRNIVKLIDFFDDKSSHWFIMEYCELGDLPQYMKTQEVNFDAKLKIMVDSSSGVAFMHNMRPPVVHRDLKPANVLMKLEGNKAVAKISDFGMGKVFKADASHFTMNSGVGTMGYMAPEFFIDGEYLHYHPGVDTFALGLMFSVVLLYDKQKPHDMVPISAESRKSGMYIHYGLELKNTYNNKALMPQLFEQNSEAEPSVQQVQEIIKQMTQFHDKDRPTVQQVKMQIMELHYEMVQDNLHTMQCKFEKLDMDHRQLQTNHVQLQTENTQLQQKNIDQTIQKKPDTKHLKPLRDVNLVSQPLQQEQPEKLSKVVVVFPYEAKNIDELTVKEGDVLEIIQEDTTDVGWTKLRFPAREGVVPNNFVKKNQKQPASALVIFPYEAENIDELTVKEGDVLEILQEDNTDVGWWKVRFPAREGVVPDNFVVANPLELAVVTFDYKAENSDELSLNKGDVVNILEENTGFKGWWKARLHDRVGLIPDNFVKKLKELYN